MTLAIAIILAGHLHAWAEPDVPFRDMGACRERAAAMAALLRQELAGDVQTVCLWLPSAEDLPA